MEKKQFIITIDTEGDNLWNWKIGDEITTENTKFLPRFQNLCNEFGFKPVWLTNYEMVMDEQFVKFAKTEQEKGNCEVGVHLHAWNNPPYYDLPKDNNAAPYLVEYPEDIMRQKFDTIIKLLTDRFETKPVTHRAGRWAMNQIYYDILTENGIKYDCSVTSGIDWSVCKGQTIGSKGSNYKNNSKFPYKVYNSRKDATIIELPVNVKIVHDFKTSNIHSIRNFIGETLRFVRGNYCWLRPNGRNLEEMIKFADEIYNSELPYAMFMLHSSELMPGGSPIFKSNEDIEKLYSDIRNLFLHIENKFKGITIRNI